MSEWIGVAIALVSSCLGGTAAAITRYLVGNADPIMLAILRWGIGFACLLPTALGEVPDRSYAPLVPGARSIRKRRAGALVCPIQLRCAEIGAGPRPEGFFGLSVPM